MFHTFIPFVFVNLLGLYYSPSYAILFLCIYFVLGVFVLRLETYHACLYSLFPAQKNYNDFTPFLKGKTILVTGANRGVGYGIVKELVSHGAHVIIACRSQLQQTLDNLRKMALETGHKDTQIQGFRIDLSDFESYLTFFKQLQNNNIKVDILVLNAGMTIHPAEQTKDGIDMMLFVNFMSNVILLRYFTKLKLFNTSAASLPRIVATSSDSHRWKKYRDFGLVYDYSMMAQVTHYAETKLWNQMVINHYTDKYRNRIDCYAHCPGPVFSDIARHAPLYMRLFAYAFMGVLFQGIDRAGRHIVYSCMQPNQLYKSGAYHWMMHDAKLSKDSLNKKYIQQLMHHANEIVDNLEGKYGTVDV